MTDALIGYTGFVGSNILAQRRFEALYNSRNISDIQKKRFDLIVCAGAPGTKWLANKNPKKDKKSIDNLISNLRKVEAKRIILISTVDVYPPPKQGYEDSPIDFSILKPYGRHRLLLEQFVAKHFSAVHIIRLPALFGFGLKKNFIYDLIHDSALELTHCKSILQFYDLNDLWKDVEIVLRNNLALVNFVTEPIVAEEVARYCFGKEFINRTDKDPAEYDIRTKYGKLFNSDTDYLTSKDVVLRKIRKFVRSQNTNHK